LVRFWVEFAATIALVEALVVAHETTSGAGVSTALTTLVAGLGRQRTARFTGVLTRIVAENLTV